jgi:serine protease AprX
MTTIRINGYVVEPHSQRAGGSQYVEDASESNYILLHCSCHLNIQLAEKLQQLHVKILKYVDENTYLCVYEPADLTKIRALPFVEYANVYHQDLVVHAGLKEKLDSTLRQSGQSAETRRLEGDPEASRAAPEDPRFYNVWLHDEDPSDEMIHQVVDLLPTDPASIVHLGCGIFRAQLSAQDFDRIARIDHVGRITEVQKLELHNHEARKVVGLIDPSAAVARLRGHHDGEIHRNVYRGDGQLVVVADTGFDMGSTTDVHKAFTGRVAKLMAYTGPSASDTSGHGTHVSGSVLGSANSLGFGSIEGTAPAALLVAQAAMDTNGELNINAKGRSNTEFYERALEDRIAEIPALPRIHNNSWGKRWPTDNRQLDYDEMALATDKFINAIQDAVIVFSAGNNGEMSSGSQIGAEAAAKNIITVGACENLQSTRRDTPLLRRTPVTYVYDKSKPEGNVSNIASFSSRGPTNEGRIKPDVVAPGTVIYSARSREPQLLIAKTRTGFDYDKWGQSPDAAWWFMNGTSMAGKAPQSTYPMGWSYAVLVPSF